MVKFITGEKGSGKTKWLIDRANTEYNSGNGNIAFLDVDDDHIFSLDYNVRLINLSEYHLEYLDSLYGFICGMMSMDYDLEQIYVDSFYKMVDMNDDEELVRIYKDLEKISTEREVEIYINIDRTVDEMPSELQEHSEDAKGVL